MYRQLAALTGLIFAINSSGIFLFFLLLPYAHCLSCYGYSLFRDVMSYVRTLPFNLTDAMKTWNVYSNMSLHIVTTTLSEQF
uniref:Putative secreted protein n=1 Tax=Amblyomma triste TaxID=251400 RepID=A0A023G013_AMBTT